MDWKAHIRDVPDFPKPGIVFKDITTLLKNGPVFKEACAAMVEPFRAAGIDVVVGAESRGFIFGAPIAAQLGVGFIPVRKPKKLPAAVIRKSYALEYGTDTVEMHTDAITRGQKVLLVDDLLATGGTALAMAQLVEEAGGIVVGVTFLIELSFLSGRKQLAPRPVHTLIDYASE